MVSGALAIWRIPEPPILFLLVGTRGNAGNGRESTLQNADVAQLVEHHLAKVDVASSNLVVRSLHFLGNPHVGIPAPGDWRSGSALP